MDNKETNKEIFDFISSDEHPDVALLHKALESTTYCYGDLKKMFYGSLTKTSQPEMAWQTPFGHFYGKNQNEHNGRFFAEDITVLPDMIHEKCKAREADGRYLPILYGYLDILKTAKGDPMYYCQMKSIIDIIKNEDYLMLSDNDDIRKIYLELLNTVESLYNIYMTEVR